MYRLQMRNSKLKRNIHNTITYISITYAVHCTEHTVQTNATIDIINLAHQLNFKISHN